MAQRKIIAVVGATGAQGGGLVRAILADPAGGFAARAITRDVKSDKARALAALGAEVVAADVDDEESLAAAFAGAYGAFCVTFYWAHFSPEKELAEARNMAHAAKAAGAAARDLVDARGHAQDRSADRRPHADADGQVQGPALRREGRGRPVLHRPRRADHVPATRRSTGTTSSTSAWARSKGPDGELQFTLPMGDEKMAGIAAEDIGARRLRHLQGRPQVRRDRSVGVAGEHLTGAEMAATLTRALGQRGALQRDDARKRIARFGFPGADDLGNMFQFYRDFEAPLNALRDVARSRELDPALLSFDAWLSKYKDRIPPG